ncbi:MAG: 8-oxoguanine deaminase [Chloroflexi bacterium CFX4]|nr:8-oxoguanine deaminase [Chloroflexi bacterium CFX4]MDL1924231.1 8-oxoguanine deaminase [Chloroflexi bacterium CFX3]
MPSLLAEHAHVLLTFDDQRREIPDGALFARDGVIEWVGSTAEVRAALTETPDETLNLRDHVLLPGLVNTHHHMFQSLTRVTPNGQDHELFGWLRAHYGMWANLRGEMIYASTLTAMAELILSGCTTSSDHLYIYPNDCRLDDSIRAATEIGMRFHATRGSMSVGESKGGLPPDRVVEDEAFILRDTQRLLETYHDAQRYAMLRIAVAPCSPFTVSQDLMRESARLARAYGVRLHTHLAENDNDVTYSLETFGLAPAEYAESVAWLGEDVWHAHCVKLSAQGIGMFARSGTGIAHCPSSNMRLASGIAPIRAMRDAGVRVGLGVDGSASNDSGHMLAEARMAMLLQRVGGDPAALGGREALEIATRGGASVLGRDDIGALAVGMAADFIAVNLNRVGFAGAWQDPASALVFCAPPSVDYSVINGRVVVREGQLTTLNLPNVLRQHNAYARQLANMP